MRRLMLLFVTVLCTVMLPPSLPDALADGSEPPPRSATHQLRSAVTGAAGAEGSAGEYSCNGTLGQSVIGLSQAGDRVLSSGFWQGYLDVITDVSPTDPQILTTLLYQNRPNPFRSNTVISYSLEAAGPVEITIYDITGRTVRTLVEGHADAGIHKLTWDGRDDAGLPVSCGVYFCRLQTQAHVSLNKMLILN